MLKKVFFLLVLSVSLVGCGAKVSSQPIRTVDAVEAQKIMATEKNYLIVDVRTPEEFADAHVAGAINIPLANIADAQPNLLPDKKQLVFVYCRSGKRSSEAAKRLNKLGYVNVVDFGGILDWNGPVEHGEKK